MVVLFTDAPDRALASAAWRARFKGATVAQLDLWWAKLSPSDRINTQFTSATTGQPKEGSLTDHDSFNNAPFLTQALAFTEDDTLCILCLSTAVFRMAMGTQDAQPTIGYTVMQRSWGDPDQTKPGSKM